MTRHAVVALGVGQCLNWGVLYYAFTVLAVPVARDLGVDVWWVTGAFSLALSISALLAPRIGRWADRGAAPLMMQAGGWTAAALLLTWAALPGLFTLYVVWMGLGACMAATLYEPAFAIVARAQSGPVERLRALALVTVVGGMASTIFLPLTDVLVRGAGWRGAVAVLAAILAASTLLTHRFALAGLPAVVTAREAPPAPDLGVATPPGPLLAWALLAFSLASFASAGLTANLVPALGERHVPASAAALLGALLGVMQLPGRILLSVRSLGASAARLVVVSLLLQAAGLLLLSAAPSIALVGGALMVFAMGAGLGTLARPHFLQSCFDLRHSGHLNGRLARWQQVGRAAGPVMAAGAAAAIGYDVVLAGLGVLFVALVVALGLVIRPRAAAARESLA